MTAKPGPAKQVGTGIGATEEEATANARLIAACPTMYEYIQKKAEDGDAEAQSIINTL
jgi:hypothetical protein